VPGMAVVAQDLDSRLRHVCFLVNARKARGVKRLCSDILSQSRSIVTCGLT
jgi:hypothetical protein